MGCFAGVEQTWASQLDVGRTHIATKGTVQSGLVLNLDAGASSSYSGIGNTWSDLSVGTGALPIYNTTNSYGTVKSTGTRTDANDSSLVLAIPMDGANNATTFTDESANIRGSGSAKSITRNGDTKTVTAVSKFYGSSGFFDGSGDYLNLGTSSDYLFGTGDFTIEGWFYLTSDSTRQDLMGNYSGSTTGWGIQTSYGVAGQIGFFCGNSILLDSAARVWSPNSWTHFAITRSGTSLKLFVNGVNTTTTTNSTDISTTSNPLFIGAITSAGSATPQLFCNGYFQDFRIYKGLEKYTSNFIPSGNPRNGTLVGSPTYSSLYGGSLTFNGSSQYATTPAINLTTAGTVSAWFYKTGTGTPDGANVVDIFSNISSNGANGWSFGLNTSTNKIDFYIANNGGFGVEDFSTQTISNNTWYNVVVTYNGSNKIIYINGVQDSTFASSVNGNATTNWSIGSRNTGARNFQGRIPQVSIYNRALSAAEISQNYNALRGRYVSLDPYISSVSLLLRNSFTDESLSPKTITANGTATISTTTVKYGTSSIAVNGLSGYITTSSSTDLGLGTGDFTVELWVYMTSTNGSGLFGFGGGYGLSNFSSGLSFWQDGGGYFYGSGTLPQNQWAHVAVTRQNSTLYIFVDGIVKSTIGSYSVNLGTTNSITIGYHPNQYNQAVNGFIDDFRVTKGISRYNSNFTPPSAELPNY